MEEAAERKISIIEKASGLEEILLHLQNKGPVIILTNANLLSCSKCNNLTSWIPSCWSGTPSYQGHYILLVGFNEKSKEILYRNPSLKDKVCVMSFDQLEEARTSYGTDEDVIFVCS